MRRVRALAVSVWMVIIAPPGAWSDGSVHRCVRVEGSGVVVGPFQEPAQEAGLRVGAVSSKANREKGKGAFSSSPQHPWSLQ